MKAKFNLFLVLIFTVLGIVGFWYWQKNLYSKEILKLEILGPEEVQAFEEIEYLVKYKNNGNTTLEEPELIFEYPENSLVSEESLRIKKTLEDIYPGEERSFSFKGRLLGNENETKTAKTSINYRPKNLKAFYNSETSFATKIKFVPLTFELDLPSRVEADRTIKFSLNYFSNSDWPISNLRIVCQYPSDFEFIKSQPSALEKNEWDIHLLNKTEGGRIEIEGKLSGQIKEQKIFQAKLGIWQNDQFILLKEAIKGVEIAKPSLSVFQQINGKSDYVASAGDLLHYEIFFRNIGEEFFSNLFLISTLEGKAFDFETLKTESGQFNTGDNSLIWDWREVPKLRFLGQGEEGKVEFWMNLKEEWEQLSPQDKNFTLKNKVIISSSSIKEEFETKINSKLEILQSGYFEDEIFGNSGPMPPQVDKTTTYTIIWQAKNYYNDLKNVKVKAILPPEVKLTGKIFPEGAKLTFDLKSREIVWDVGNLGPGQGVLSEAANIAFQVAQTPGPSQKGQILTIINTAEISGEDQFTEQILKAQDGAIDTTLPDDSTITKEMGRVQ
ncbi:hypothetical protein ACFL0A_01825 [Patescibacteria group bacterium]